MELDILFIYPFVKNKWAYMPQMPTQLILLASFLEKKGFSARIADMCLEKLNIQQILGKIKRYNPKIIGIYTSTFVYKLSLQISHIIKQEFPEIKIVLGGPHITTTFAETFSLSKDVDFLIPFEAEKPLLELTKHIISTNKKGKNIKKIKGVIYKENDKIKYTGEGEIIEDLNTLPFLRLELIDGFKERKFRYFSKKPRVLINTSRGCPYSCSFCIACKTFRGKQRYLSAQRMIKELEYFSSKYGVKMINISDSIFSLDNKRFEEFCKKIKPLELDWIFNERADNIKKQNMIEAKKAGCELVLVGVESANNNILELFNKRTTVQKIKQGFDTLNKTRIKTAGYFMIGSHLETKKTIENNIRFIKKTKLEGAIFSVLFIYPGTNIYEQYVRMKLIDPLWYIKNIEKGHLQNRFSEYRFLKKLNKRTDILRKYNYNTGIRKYAFIVDKGIEKVFG